jgi:adenylyltransferase/sulfurtransferase
VSTRLVLNKAAVRHRIAFMHGAVMGFEGRAMTVLPGRSACINCISRGPIPPEKFPVIGVAPAIIGSIQACETIKYIIGTGALLTNEILSYDGLANEFMTFKIKRNPQCEHCGQVHGKE